MAEDHKEPWLNYLALTTVVLAVCATLSTFRGSSYSTRAVLSQNQAANQWSYFQSKSIKGYLYEVQKEELEAELESDGANWSADKLNRYRNLAKAYGDRLARYDSEKVEIQQVARRLEAVRNHAQDHSRTFGVAVIYLQIAILLCSISGLLKKKPLWLLGGMVGGIGVFYFLAGMLTPMVG